MKIISHLIVICLFPAVLMAQSTPINATVSAGDLIQTIIAKTGAATIPNTVDVIKEGNADTKVTGIITCMFATMEVLKKAVEKNCNLVIAHEPLYYNHLDKTEFFKDDSVYLEKKKYINDHKLVIWRFHDYIHRIRPDGIMTGMINKLGWAAIQMKDNPYRFNLPSIPLSALLEKLKKVFPANAFYVVGNPEMKLSGVAFVPGASGTNAHIQQLRDSTIDVVIAGEVPQWETYEYVRDAVTQGRNKAIVFIGHINSEESGMQFCADWLKEFIKNTPIFFVECGSSFWSY